MHQLNHVHMLGKAYLVNPPRTVEVFNDWLKVLVERIDMKILMGPYSIDCKTLGNEGITGVIVIETSHCSGHVWHAVERPFMTWDVYSCVLFNPDVVIRHIHEHFQIDELSYTVLDRNDVPVVIKSGIVEGKDL